MSELPQTNAIDDGSAASAAHGGARERTGDSMHQWWGGDLDPQHHRSEDFVNNRKLRGGRYAPNSSCRHAQADRGGHYVQQATGNQPRGLWIASDSMHRKQSRDRKVQSGAASNKQGKTRKEGAANEKPTQGQSRVQRMEAIVVDSHGLGKHFLAEKLAAPTHPDGECVGGDNGGQQQRRCATGSSSTLHDACTQSNEQQQQRQTELSLNNIR